MLSVAGAYKGTSSYEMVVAGVGAGVGGRWVRARLGEEARVGCVFFGGDLRRFFFAANVVVVGVGVLNPTIASQKESSGKPSTRNAVSRATISDSVEECETTVCFLHTAFNGKNVLGPTNAAKIPVVEREVLTQSANDASVNIMIERCFAESPIQP